MKILHTSLTYHALKEKVHHNIDRIHREFSFSDKIIHTSHISYTMNTPISVTTYMLQQNIHLKLEEKFKLLKSTLEWNYL